MTVREIIIQKAKALALDGYDIAHACKKLNNGQFIVSVDHVNKYLRGEKDMTSEKLDAVLEVLELDLIDKHPY